MNTETQTGNLPEPQNSTYAYVQAFIDELYRAGVHNIVICPGSRSTPLALVTASHPHLRSWMHIDERSAAFFALGMAKKARQPVALLCTSGTAAANFFPAIVEANLTHIPLLILTADRPHELRDNGAPQTIDQNHLYGSHVKWFAEVALPEASNSALRYIRTLACRASALTQALPAGPVHINMPFREPLTPDPIPDQPLPVLELRDPVAWHGRSDGKPYVQVSETPFDTASLGTTIRTENLVYNTPRGLIIAGPHTSTTLNASLLKLARRLGYPILADPLSQLRNGPSEHDLILTAYDAFLRLDSFVANHRPELVLRFGAMPTAKPVLLYLKKHPDCRHIVVDAQGDWNEPTQLATDLIHADPVAFCNDLLTALNAEKDHQHDDNSWLSSWQRTDRVTRQALQTTITAFTQPFEGRIFTELNTLLPSGSTLFAGNSMPVRDLDTFFWSSQRQIHIAGNRGANGIDGIISSALGISAQSKPDEPSVLVIGDLSFYHDLNGLLAAKLHNLNQIIILVNNDGGGIFSFLPQAAHPEHFEQVFGTPTGLPFQPVVEMYGGTYHAIEDWSHFRAAFQQGVLQGGLHVLEVRTERDSNVTMHRQLWQAVAAALAAHE